MRIEHETRLDDFLADPIGLFAVGFSDNLLTTAAKLKKKNGKRGPN